MHLKRNLQNENTAFYKSIEKQTAAYKADQDARNLIDKMALEKKLSHSANNIKSIKFTF
jgi:hypothetical protein